MRNTLRSVFSPWVLLAHCTGSTPTETSYLLKPRQQHRVTSGIFTKSTLTQVASHKPYQHNPKVSPFGIAIVKKMQIKLGDAGTFDGLGLAFQYQMKTFFYIEKNGQEQSQLKKCYVNA